MCGGGAGRGAALTCWHPAGTQPPAGPLSGRWDWNTTFRGQNCDKWTDAHLFSLVCPIRREIWGYCTTYSFPEVYDLGSTVEAAQNKLYCCVCHDGTHSTFHGRRPNPSLPAAETLPSLTHRHTLFIRHKQCEKVTDYHWADTFVSSLCCLLRVNSSRRRALWKQPLLSICLAHWLWALSLHSRDRKPK